MSTSHDIGPMAVADELTNAVATYATPQQVGRVDWGKVLTFLSALLEKLGPVLIPLLLAHAPAVAPINQDDAAKP